MTTLTYTDAHYPALLRESPHPPPTLFVAGTLSSASVPTVAIVGTRRPPAAALLCARVWATFLARRGVHVVSGMAFGIDAAAHEGALAGGGTTTAVLPSPLDRPYPALHRSLAHSITERGALITEYASGTPTYKHHFLHRNRIIAGMSHATLVIAAPARSGACVTAQYAATAGRDVLVVPSTPDDPAFVGSHNLLREGATLVYAPEQVCEALGVDTEAHASDHLVDDVGVPAGDLPAASCILSALRTLGPSSIDKIVDHTKLDTHVVSATLALLSLTHAVTHHNLTFTIARR